LEADQGDIGMLQPFGCGVVFHVAKETQEKGTLRGADGVMLRYEWDNGTYAYQVWDLKKHQVFITQDVRFNEGMFPFKYSQQTVQHQSSQPPQTSVVPFEGLPGWDDDDSSRDEGENDGNSEENGDGPNGPDPEDVDRVQGDAEQEGENSDDSGDFNPV